MAELEYLSSNSWKQPFKDRRKELELWEIHRELKGGFKDKTNRLLNIKFEDKFGIDKTDNFRITSGREIRFPREFQNEIKKIVLGNPESYFIVTVLDPPHISFTPSDIIWIKNVTNKKGEHAYMDLKSDKFVLHFPNKIGVTANIYSPKVGDIILIRQLINSIPVFTHLVTPTDMERVDENKRTDYRYGRNVRVIAKTELKKLIPVSSTHWNRVNFQGVSHGNACKIETMKSVGDISELRLNIWQEFHRYFIPQEEESVNNTASYLKEIEIDYPEVSKPEGKLRLVSHYAKERNPEIVRRKKQQAIENNLLKCEVCTFSFQDKYNATFIECHHLTPIGTGGERNTELKDLALVCSNCHRMLHKKFDGQYLLMQQLQKRIKSL